MRLLRIADLPIEEEEAVADVTSMHDWDDVHNWRTNELGTGMSVKRCRRCGDGFIHRYHKESFNGSAFKGGVSPVCSTQKLMKGEVKR